MAKIYAYKGILGFNGWKEGYPETLKDDEEITLEHLTDALINDPTQEGQLGFVCLLKKCQFTKEAIDLLKIVEKSRDAIGDVDINSSNEGPILAWLGGALNAKDVLTITGSRDYDPSLLPEPTDLEIPQTFIDFVDSLPKDNETKK